MLLNVIEDFFIEIYFLLILCLNAGFDHLKFFWKSEQSLSATIYATYSLNGLFRGAVLERDQDKVQRMRHCLKSGGK
jgi:hypothetical protein